ncbi:hypothetical protein [Mycolicibacterium sp. CBMA 361]|uniref:hypothetical protein n=1 Tax=Mycolicibacterium sp. CBMA 361 TaxID=2606610 RepID=UPI0012DCC7D3|nr:hypothetical protein [Mycolicibacterium sp. CBMA 361]MUM05406.1 hypothetical protein [Mycolicibacterium sp. CBMA 213]MUM31682.1 hypothetical protein [Mycolicibacterium sp. CBMA 361]
MLVGNGAHNDNRGLFPPVLKRATIYTPADADADEQQAVLALVSNLAQRYHDRPTVITVVNQRRGATPPAAGDLARSAVVERAENASLKVENPGTPNAFLRIFGRGADLSAQLSLFATDLQGLAQTDTARVDQAGASDTRPSGNTMTFRELKMSGSTDVLRTSNVSVGVA